MLALPYLYQVHFICAVQVQAIIRVQCYLQFIKRGRFHSSCVTVTMFVLMYLNDLFPKKHTLTYFSKCLLFSNSGGHHGRTLYCFSFRACIPGCILNKHFYFYMHLSLVSPSAPSVEYVGTEGQVWLAQQGLISRLILQGQQDGSAEKGSCCQPNLTM